MATIHSEHRRSPSEMFKTDDMALAAFLEVSGHESQSVECVPQSGRGPKCFWHFPRAVSLDGLVVEYAQGQARVEPREFQVKIASVRDMMYRALDGMDE